MFLISLYIPLCFLLGKKNLMEISCSLLVCYMALVPCKWGGDFKKPPFHQAIAKLWKKTLLIFVGKSWSWSIKGGKKSQPAPLPCPPLNAIEQGSVGWWPDSRPFHQEAIRSCLRWWNVQRMSGKLRCIGAVATPKKRPISSDDLWIWWLSTERKLSKKGKQNILQVEWLQTDGQKL